MATFDIEVNGVDYRGETAPATKQWEALHLFLNSPSIIKALTSQPSDRGLVFSGHFNVNFDDVKKLESLLLKGNVWRKDDDLPVAANLFQDKIADYTVLLLKVVEENVGSFLELRNDNGSAAIPEQTSKA